MADLIISQPMTFTVDVRNGLVERPQRESLMRGDKMANRIIAELVYGSEPFDITGVTVKGKFCRPPSGDEIDLVGEAKGNVAEVQLTDQCYTSGGHYEASVILVLGGVERTVLFISGDVLKSGSGNAASDEETGGSGGSTGSGLPAGGTAGQVLVKVSSAQGDAIWKTLTAADVGALGKNETAVNAKQLNGNSAEYYYNKGNLVFDDAPVEGSTNPITSGAVHSAIASVSTEYKREEKGDMTYTLGTDVTAHNIDLRRRDNIGLLSCYFKFGRTIANAGVVATITLPEGFELECIQPSSLSKGASNSTISSIGASVDDGVITLVANGDISVDNYVRHNWVVFYK